MTDSIKSSGMANQFHRFPDLAPEIRVKIWKFHLHVPRRIELIAKLYVDCEKCEGQDRYEYVGGRPPVLLSVNQESRHEALIYYRPMLRAGFLDSEVDHYEQHQPDSQPRSDHDLRAWDCIYLNTSIDIVSCSYNFADCGYLFHSLVVDRIEHLKITVDLLGLGSATIPYFEKEIQSLIMELRYGEFLKSLKLISNYARPDSLLPEWRMDRFMIFFEHSISRYKAWRFPEFNLVCKETGFVLAKRQLCTCDEKQDNYEWELMGVKTTYPRVYTIGEPEVDASS